MATYYVSTGGSDSNAGTLILPWATFDYAWAQICDGDWINEYFKDKENFEEVKK